MESNNNLNAKSISRIAAIQTLYQFQIHNNELDVDWLIDEIIKFYQDDDIKNDYQINMKIRISTFHLKKLVKLSCQNLEEIDQIIREYLSKDWKIETLPRLLLAIIRVAICEIKFFADTPAKVVINEYTDIADSFVEESEIGFINSVLDKYTKLVRS